MQLNFFTELLPTASIFDLHAGTVQRFERGFPSSDEWPDGGDSWSKINPESSSGDSEKHPMNDADVKVLEAHMGRIITT